MTTYQAEEHTLNKEPVKVEQEPPEKHSRTGKKLICNNLTSAAANVCCLRAKYIIFPAEWDKVIHF